ncbi:Imidazolonepropionase [Candidatus Kryptonium thompsonii]|jgi:imidazolonepropionase-like amidohydrolase|uniref:Imidazolonepropionase n=3 Tax=Candidatus Kryptonium thompsonii TaxID=1633631 RepID=A0A0N7MSX0_9BACT|nr:amidohydrolase family protein [Candidatus Kryptonium thompsoni]CUS88619.1 Imidazolonepropionase [Candidatus Kryptonium thompsoni]CUS90748.1 Imidazolonepropionase [Candidatus Kryptonium thompsoni]CUS94789.1 Imidazolonepropionase [Candidatus Kryptonium thompsoni]CUS97555.1 Imidazolonepropionase [Candidatus Kryptonium thompsoni]CUT03458.1 Imidazolonepropionase [Candidatus Kryptonium thompsoni]
MRKILFILLFTFPILLFAQQYTKPVEGLRDNPPKVFAFTNVKIVQSPGKVIEKGTVVVRNGIIQAVGADVQIPEDAQIIDLSGKVLYPGFIDLYTNYGMPKRREQTQREAQQPTPIAQQPKPEKGAPNWNPNVLSDKLAINEFSPDPKEAEKLRAQGFVAVLSVPTEGIFKGKSVLVTLADDKSPNNVAIKPQVAHHIAFVLGFGRDIYPNSLMGNIALIRQTFLDAQWYASAWDAFYKNPSLQRPEVNSSLEALQGALKGELVTFETNDELDFLRCAKIAKEFSLNAAMIGSGYEYRRAEAIKNTGFPVILPVNFPKPPDVENPDDADNIDLRTLKHWYNAPENPKRLYEAGITFAFTTYRLENTSEFLQKVREAVERGLPQDVALSALTITPAKLIGVDKLLGSIEPGKMANFVVTNKNIFEDGAKILQVWIDGKKYDVEGLPEFDPRGEWKAYLNKDTLNLSITGQLKSLRGRIKKNDKSVNLITVSLLDNNLTLAFNGDSVGISGVVRISAFVKKDKIEGYAELLSGERLTFSAVKISEPRDETPQRVKKVKFEPLPVVYPDGAFGFAKQPEQPEYVLVKNATIWTCSNLGKLENADMLIRRGIIEKIGKNIEPPKGAVVIDATGKHVTPGIIDAHSHTAISGGVNESTQAITAEVRIQDVINSDDINIYRQLAGGVTAANILHGSANPIGGQNAVIKYRWGLLADELIFKEAPAGIKFALGENVKQSNWGDRYTTRYPQTRMGVEQIIRDAFKSALDYEKAWNTYREESKKKILIPPRRDLQLEALLEILKGQRLVHAHSYRQDEILMLLRVAEDFGFRIATLQHVLEGYKIAEAIAKHGAGASTFSDWWAYKFEVYDAIPHNGTLMEKVGVITSFNSDSDELARRLNLEAAKAVKYGGLTEEEALKLVTINPAKQLRIDKYVGSLEPGKHADFVIWSGNPLSTYTICEQTWIEGRKYFDRNEDLMMRGFIKKQRAFIIQKILEVKSSTRQQPQLATQ